MPAIYSRNCILEGVADLYCLACHAYLKSEDDAILHIQGSKHKEIMNFLGYFEKHEEDFIRKVNDLYFCEVCNVTMSTSTKVKLHVTETAHISGRRSRSLSRSSRGEVVSLAGVRVSEDAWHGLVDDTCVLCGVEGVHLDTHTDEKSHMLNLIHATVTIGDGEDIYRKIDDVYQCLTCNKVVSEQLLTKHLESNDHKEIIANCIKDQSNLVNTKNDQNSSKGEMTTQKTQETAKEDDESRKVDENVTKNESKVSITNNAKALAKKHGLFIKDKNNVYCDVCSTQISATVDNINEHVISQNHMFNEEQEHNKTKTDAPKAIKKINLNQYISKIKLVIQVSATNRYYVILNNKYCLQLNSFMGLNSYRNQIICAFCNIDLLPENMKSHMKNESHFDLVVNSLVIDSLDDEFVRQIKSDMFHCGYCSKTENDYDDMLDHLATSDHNTCKAELSDILVSFKNQLNSGLVDYDTVFINCNFTSLRGFF